MHFSQQLGHENEETPKKGMSADERHSVLFPHWIYLNWIALSKREIQNLILFRMGMGLHVD